MGIRMVVPAAFYLGEVTIYLLLNSKSQTQKDPRNRKFNFFTFQMKKEAPCLRTKWGLESHFPAPS